MLENGLSPIFYFTNLSHQSFSLPSLESDAYVRTCAIEIV